MVLVKSFIAILTQWTNALDKEYGCCLEHKMFKSKKVLSMTLRFRELTTEKFMGHISPSESVFLLTQLIDEMLSELKTLRGLESLDKAMETAIVQKEARA